MKRLGRRIGVIRRGYRICGWMYMLVAIGLLCSEREVFAAGQRGSISVFTCYDQEVVSGGTVTLYQVGTYGMGENADFQLADAFDGCKGFQSDSFWKNYILGAEETAEKEQGSASCENGMAYYKGSAAEYAANLADYAIKQRIAGITGRIDEAGIARFENLRTGIYLLLQKESAAGYQKIEPFLAAVPALEEGRPVYDVAAWPKMEQVPETIPDGPEETEEPERVPETEKPGKTETESKKENVLSDEKVSENGNSLAENVKSWLSIPQTGQMRWPVPVLALTGVAMIIAGRIVQRRKRR